MIALRGQNNNLKETKFVIIIWKNLLVIKCFFWIIAEAGAGAENMIFFWLQLQQKTTAPDGSGSATLLNYKP